MKRRDRTRLDGKRTLAWSAAALGLFVAAGPQACTQRYIHGGEDPVYPLRGLHAAVPCEGCHGPGTPQALPTGCIDCHAGDVPDPNHYPGQNCVACHVEDGWDQVATPTGPTDTGTTFTGYDHAAVAPDTLCWTCHEVDRPDTPTPGSPTHYADEVEARRSDCGPCHGLREWLGESPSGNDGPYEHEIRSPHGTFSDGAENPATEWVVACIDCHPTPEVYTTFDCQTCHLPLITTPPGHAGITEATPENNLACVEACHPTGE